MITFPSCKYVIKKHLPIVEGIVKEYINYPIPFKMMYKRGNAGLKHFSVILPKEFSYYNEYSISSSRSIELVKLILSKEKIIIIDDDTNRNWDLNNRHALLDIVDIINNKIEDNLFWRKISHGNLPIDFVRKYNRKIDWFRICCSSHEGIPISEDIINEFHHKLTWTAISKQKLSDNLLRDFQDKIIWHLYLEHNDLDLNMIKQNIAFSTFRSILGN